MTFTGADGKPLLDMLGWEMAVLNDKDDDSGLRYDRRAQDRAFLSGGSHLQVA